MSFQKTKTNHLPRLILCGLFMLVCLLALSHGEAKAASIVASGDIDECYWTIDSDGLLTIGPTNGVSGEIQGSNGTNLLWWPWSKWNKCPLYKTVYIEPGVSIRGKMDCMFAIESVDAYDNLVSADLSNLDTSNVTSMRYLFAGRKKNLVSVDCSGWDTRNVTTMAHMFHGTWSGTERNCEKLVSIIGLEDFDTSNVTDMSYMFYGCKSLGSLDLSSFNTGNVTDMRSMFSGCRGLSSLDVSSFNTGSVANMSSMFSNCSSLSSLDVSNFNTGNVTNMSFMFRGCSSLKDLDVSHFSTGMVTDMSYMFRGCSSLKDLDPSSFNTERVNNMGSMFYGCSGLNSLNVSSFNTGNVTDMSYMFRSCSSLSSLDLTNFITNNVTTMAGMFDTCSELQELNLSSFNSENVTSMVSFLSNTNKLTSIAVGTKTFASASSNKIYKYGLWERYATLGGMGVYPGETAEFLYDVKGNTPQHPDGWWKPFDTVIPNSGNIKWHYISEEGRQKNEWVKSEDGRTWSYTFKVADENQTYYIWETDPLPEGYVGDWVIGKPLVYDKDRSDTPKITNTREDYETGSLVISKSIAAGYTSDVSFVFHIVITGPDGSLSGIFGDVVLTDGEATVALAGGESVTLSDIPVGSSYTVWEDTPAGYTVVPASGVISGSILEATIYPAAFVNTPPPPPPTGGFTLSKEVTGRFGESGTYEFLVAFQGLEALRSYTYLHLAEGVAPTDPEAKQVSFTADSIGNAFVDITLGAKEKAVFSGLPEGAGYTVTEFGGSGWTASYTVTSDQTVTKADGSAEGGTDLTTGEEYVEAEENATITFTNELYKTQNLRLQKWVEDADPDRSFDFTVLFSNLEPNTYYTASHKIIDFRDDSEKAAGSFGRFRSDADGYLEWKVQLKHGDVIIFEGLPVGATYQITEAACPYRASYEMWGKDVEIIVKYDDENENPDQSLSTAKETVDDGEEITVMFWNDEVQLTKVTVEKIWQDGDNLDDLRSPSIKVQLYAGKDAEGKPVPYGEPVTLTAKQNGTADKNTWSYTWEDLIAYESDGVTPIAYTVREEEVIGYDGWNEEPVITGDAEHGYIVTITNKLHEYELLLAKVDQDNNTTGIAGAEFSLYPSDYLNADGSVNADVKPLGNFVSEVENGAPKPISLGTRAVGTYYLVETKAPEHYSQLSTPLKLTIVKNGTATLEQEGEETAAVVDPDNKTVLFTVTNKHHYNFQLVKVDQDNNTIGVKGAVFRLYPSDYIKADGTVDTSVDDLGKFTSDVGENGAPKAIELGEYPAGTYYLVETKAPSNYVKLTSPVKLTVLEDGTATMEIGGSTTNAAVNAETKTVTFTVPNPQGTNLPGVGGSGTELFYLAGLSLVLLGGAALLVSRKKRETERVRSERP